MGCAYIAWSKFHYLLYNETWWNLQIFTQKNKIKKNFSNEIMYRAIARVSGCFLVPQKATNPIIF